MTPRQRRFVSAIVRGLTGKAAALEAGYSAKSAESQASQLLKLPQVSAAVANAEARGLALADLSAAQIKRDLYTAHLEARAAQHYGAAVAALGKLLDKTEPDSTPHAERQSIRFGGKTIWF